MNKSIFVLHNY